MDILAIIPYTPSLIRTRSYNLLLSLVKRGHKITLATLWENTADLQSLSELDKAGIEVVAVPLGNGEKILNIVRGFFSDEPIQAHFSRSKALIRKLETRYLSIKPDMVHVEHLRGSLYAVWAKRYFRGECPILWDAVDSISLLFERMIRHGKGRGINRIIARLELRRTRKFEGWLVSQCSQTIVTGHNDCLQFMDLRNNACSQYNINNNPIKVLQNGVNLKQFWYASTNECVHPPKIVFSGKMSYHANEAAALWLIYEIMPIVWRERPDILVQFVGASPKRILHRLAKQNPQHINFTGYVPDIVPYLQSCTLAVAPILYGTGIQNKVIEAMACGAPIIATSQAISALKLEVDKDLLVADDSYSFARAILQLIDDPVLRRQLSARGRLYVQKHHNWEKIIQEYELITYSMIHSITKNE